MPNSKVMPTPPARCALRALAAARYCTFSTWTLDHRSACREGQPRANAPSDRGPVTPTMTPAAGMTVRPREGHHEKNQFTRQPAVTADIHEELGRCRSRAGFDARGAANSRPVKRADPDRQPQFVHGWTGLRRRKQF